VKSVRRKMLSPSKEYREAKQIANLMGGPYGYEIRFISNYSTLQLV
jgi:hypothetical protein